MKNCYLDTVFKLKEQELLVTKASVYIGVLFGVIDLIESRIIEDYSNPEDILLDEGFYYPESLASKVRSSSEVTIRVYSGYPDSYIGEFELEDIHTKITVVNSEYTYTGFPYYEAFRKAATVALTFDRELIRGMADRTTRSGIEYIIMYTNRGSLLRLEGEYLRVRLPFVRIAGSIHTHPEGSCGLSRADVESGLDLLSEGGFFEASATLSCAFLMYRRGLVSEDAYISVKSMKSNVIKPLNLGSIIFEPLLY